MIKGDARFLNIAAASVLAKTERDDFMKKLHSKSPDYGWDTNKGYQPAPKDQSVGVSQWHRKSFIITHTNAIRLFALLTLYHALFGVCFVLFAISQCSTYRRQRWTPWLYSSKTPCNSSYRGYGILGEFSNSQPHLSSFSLRLYR